jgi:hypothetical protein
MISHPETVFTVLRLRVRARLVTGSRVLKRLSVLSRYLRTMNNAMTLSPSDDKQRQAQCATSVFGRCKVWYHSVSWLTILTVTVVIVTNGFSDRGGRHLPQASPWFQAPREVASNTALTIRSAAGTTTGGWFPVLSHQACHGASRIACGTALMISSDKDDTNGINIRLHDQPCSHSTTRFGPDPSKAKVVATGARPSPARTICTQSLSEFPRGPLKCIDRMRR